ncbi:hypothetical protein SAMN06296036_121134 [Pseudobacteriovorax antillogorgiicola]|uniref:Uncharacterized protein n=1 Tax=Pseudobacteriovorax antillogorgiicola TaxID=1513793 RepID=A0A1Y6CI52_9BACT|nr:hypothetical protein EDD56_121134 [Pseudobacteriovorax antillogorgiicola]SMF63318.1 hypothetical protein SAMN06296036_121134 [Pseudobacteriovorax antillogorgiicola]
MEHKYIVVVSPIVAQRKVLGNKKMAENDRKRCFFHGFTDGVLQRVGKRHIIIHGRFAVALVVGARFE